jgi:hypothetical protein
MVVHFAPRAGTKVSVLMAKPFRTGAISERLYKD